MTGVLTTGVGRLRLTGDNAGFCEAILRKHNTAAPLRLESLRHVRPREDAAAEQTQQQPLVVNLLMQLRAYYDQNNTFLRSQAALNLQLTNQLRQVLSTSNGAVRARAGEIERAIRSNLYREGEFRRAMGQLTQELKKNENRPPEWTVDASRSGPAFRASGRSAARTVSGAVSGDRSQTPSALRAFASQETGRETTPVIQPTATVRTPTVPAGERLQYRQEQTPPQVTGTAEVGSGKQHMMAKNSIRALGKQLEGTLPAAANRTGRSRLIGDVCERVKGKKFNAAAKPDGTGGLASMIDAAMADGTGTAANRPGQEDPSKPELTSKQKNLLTSMKVLETSRAASKEAASDSRKDALFGALGLVGSLTSLIGSFLKNKIVGAIVGMVGSLLGAAGAVRDAVGAAQDSGEKRQIARNEERDSKVAACQGAMMQMSALPPLSLEALQTAKQEQLPLSAGQLEAAEQYAAVFNMIQSANVEMTDFLYAIEMGNFGGQDAFGNKVELDQSLRNMYRNLSFTT